MKKQVMFILGLFIVFCFTATLVWAEPPIPKIKLVNKDQILQQLRKGEEILVKSKEAQLKRNELLKKHGEKTIKKQGKTVVTTLSPVPENDLKLLRPLVPILTPHHLNEIMKELVDMQLNLSNYLINQQINMTQQMINQLNPQTAQDTLNQINQTIADLTGVSTVVDTVNDFFESVFGW